MDKGLLLFYDWEIALDSLSGDDFKALIMAMLRYKHYEKKPPEFKGTTRIIASILFPQVQRELESIHNGKKGGRPKKEGEDITPIVKEEKAVEKKISEPKALAKSMEDVPTPSQSKGTEKKKYGEFNNVLLSEEEYGKLKEKFPQNYQKRIDDLSFYIQSKGDNYSSHYATILSWDRNKKEEVSSSSTGNSYNTFDTDDFFQCALERSNHELKKYSVINNST